mmetsp:Transcript_100206/g.251233  ORF Transcript_100206/g.251233 Transcript_100206/m.251233 type:complete len:404 (-) Transcript_100206:1746-2957(-)
MHRPLGVVLPHVLHLQFRRPVAAWQHRMQELLVVLRPLAHWQLLDLEAIVRLVPSSPGVVRALAQGLNHSLEASIPRTQRLHLLLRDPEAEILDDSQGVIVWDVCAPARTNAGRTIHQDHRDDGNIKVGFDFLAILVQVVEDCIIKGGENEAGERHQARVDVPGTGMVTAPLDACPKLPRWHQQVDVVGAHKVLRHGDDRAGERGLAVMVGAVLTDVAHELCDLHVRPQVPLEAAIQDFSLSRLEAIHDGGDAPHHAVLGELHKLKIDEVLVGHGGLRVVHKSALLIPVHPRLSVVCPRLAKRHVNELPVLLRLPLEVQAVVLHGFEVLFGFCRGAGTQALVVLDLPALATIMLGLPVLVLVLCEESDHFTSFRSLYNWCDKLLHEAAPLQQVWPPEVKQVDK